MGTATPAPRTYTERYLEQVRAKEYLVLIIAEELEAEQKSRRMKPDEIVRFVLMRVYP